MRGINTLVLNEATMVAALQYFLDNVLIKDSSLEATSLSYNTNRSVYEVIVKPKETKSDE